MVTPFAISDWQVGKALSAEMRAQQSLFTSTMSASAIEHLKGQSFNWWQKLSNRFQLHYSKLNATENLEAKQVAVRIQFADTNPSTWSVRKEPYLRRQEKTAVFPSITSLYNPMGKILVAIGSTPMTTIPLASMTSSPCNGWHASSIK